MTVSVIIPAYGEPRYLATAVGSALAQDFGDVEVIVVNDGSPHGTEIEAAIEPFRDRITYLTRPNGGPAAARNTGLRAASGRYIAFLDGDDYWDPGFLSAQMAYLQRRPDYGMVYADARLFGNSPLAGRTAMEMEPSRGSVSLESLLALRCNITTSTTVVLAAPVRAVGMFDERLRHVEDYDLWLRLAHAGTRIGYHRKVLAHRRLHDHQTSADFHSMHAAVLSVLERVEREWPLTKVEQSSLRATIAYRRSTAALYRAKRSLVDGEFASAAEALADVTPPHRSWKAALALATLRLAPMVVYHGYILRERILGPHGGAPAQRADGPAPRPASAPTARADSAGPRPGGAPTPPASHPGAAAGSESGAAPAP